MARHQPILSPDSNRPGLESRIAWELKDGVPDSLFVSVSGEENARAGRTPRVLLLVPPYTRISRPLDLMLQNLSDAHTDGPFAYTAESFADDLTLIRALQSEGITRLEEMKRAGIPMGLLRVGTAARNAGYDMRIIDAVFEGWGQEQKLFTSSEGSEVLQYGLDARTLAEKIREFNPDIVGISIDYTHQWGNARALVDLVKQVNETIPVVVGGTHATGLPEDVLLDSPADYVVLRQADVTFPLLLDTLTGRKKMPVGEIEGIAYRKGGGVRQTRPRAFLEDFSPLASPDYSLVNLALYSGPYHSGGRRKTDEGYLVYGFTSAGCNTRCTFCAIPGVQGGWTRIDETRLDRNLADLVDLGVREFIVEDDHLLHDPLWALKVCDALENHHLPWFEEGGIGLFNLIALLPELTESEVRRLGNGRAETIYGKTLDAKRNGVTTESMIRRMAESGCYSVYLAVESANADSLGTSNKPRLNSLPHHTQRVVELFRAAGIAATAGLMLGFVNPTGDGAYVESREQIMNTIRYGAFLREYGATFINPFLFTPLPGAPHFKALLPYATRNTDEGYSHEFCTLTTPHLSKDERNLLRVKAIVDGNGMEGYKMMLQTGTWAT